MFKSLPVVHVLQHGGLLLGVVVLRDDHQVPLQTRVITNANISTNKITFAASNLTLHASMAFMNSLWISEA